MEAERRRSGRLVLRAQEEERRRLARDLHDEVNQALTAILLRLQALAQDAPSPERAAELAELKRLVNQAMDELLQLARQLRPTRARRPRAGARAGGARCGASRDQHGIEARLKTQGEADALGDDQQIAVYRVAQEALANVARHSAARARGGGPGGRGDSGLELRVRDDGGGFHTQHPSAPAWASTAWPSAPAWWAAS